MRLDFDPSTTQDARLDTLTLSVTLVTDLVRPHLCFPAAPGLLPARSLRWWGTAARLVAFRHHGRRLVVERLPSLAPPEDRLASWSTAARLASCRRRGWRLVVERLPCPLVPPG